MNTIKYNGNEYDREIIALLVKHGFETDKVGLIENDLNLGICGVGCRIGNGAFYFLSSEDEGLSIAQVCDNYTPKMLYDMISQTLIDLYNEVDSDESTYYISVLMQGLLKFIIQYEDNTRREFIVPKEWFNKYWDINSIYDLSDVFCLAVLDHELIGEVYYE